MNSCEICLPVPMSKPNLQAHVVRLANLREFLSLGRVLLGVGTSSSARRLGPDRVYWATPGLGAGADKYPHRYSTAVFTCGQIFFKFSRVGGATFEELRFSCRIAAPNPVLPGFSSKRKAPQNCS